MESKLSKDVGIIYEPESIQSQENIMWWFKQEHLDEREILEEILQPVRKAEDQEVEKKEGWFKLPVF